MHNSGNISFDAGRPAHRCKLTAEINSNLQFFLLMRFTTTLMITSIPRIFLSAATCAFFAQVESCEQAGSDNRLSPPGDEVCPDMPIYLISGQIITSPLSVSISGYNNCSFELGRQKMTPLSPLLKNTVDGPKLNHHRLKPVVV